MITGIEAVERIEKKFPQLKEEMQEDQGLLHLQIGTFSCLVQSFIDNEERQNFERACILFVELFQNPLPSLENALNVSFLEHLNFNDGKKVRSWAYKAMPQTMRKAWEEMDDYNNNLHKHH